MPVNHKHSDTRETRRAAIEYLLRAGSHTQEAIAETVGISRQRVSQILAEMQEAENNIRAARRAAIGYLLREGYSYEEIGEALWASPQQVWQVHAEMKMKKEENNA